MTTVALVIGLKGMPMGKTLVGSLLQPRDYRVTKIKRKQIAVRVQYSALTLYSKSLISLSQGQPSITFKQITVTGSS